MQDYQYILTPQPPCIGLVPEIVRCHLCYPGDALGSQSEGSRAVGGAGVNEPAEDSYSLASFVSEADSPPATMAELIQRAQSAGKLSSLWNTEVSLKAAGLEHSGDANSSGSLAV